jgi:diaminohydroxyphosphoribosylaminopyrimidine deaminase/5-amino-6-(5-phosphoribosylamino)uracil reductase
MRRALELALLGRGMTSPNPMVGAVIVRGGKVISEGWHERAGAPHAEAAALKKAGEKARGADLYVTLEPCCHLEKRTPPCVREIIAAGIKKVFAATADPNPHVSGKGFAALKKAGIEVRTGLLEAEARRLNEAYFKFITGRVPFVILKIAMSMDGKIATSRGQSKWITGEEARALVHQVRFDVDAVLTAVGTVRADDPLLTSRTEGGQNNKKNKKNPVRIVIDPDLLTPPGSRILRTPPETIIVSRKKLPTELVRAGVKSIVYEGKLSMQWLMKKLGEAGIISVLIEGGSSLNAHAIEDGVVDKVMLFYAPKIIGGKEAITAIGGKGAQELAHAVKLKDISVRKVGEDFLLEAYIDKGLQDRPHKLPEPFPHLLRAGEDR